MERNMSGRNMESYLNDAEAFEALSEDEQARLFAGETLEGDTEAAEPAEESIDTPADDPDKPAAEAEPEPVILAKDGQHTIPFSELESARARAQQLEQELLELKASKAEQPATDPESFPVSLADRLADLDSREDAIETAFDEGEIDRNELRKQLREIANARMDLKLAEAQAAQRQQMAQERAVADVGKRVEALVEQYPFLNPQGADTNQKAIDLVVLQRDKFVAEGMSFGDAIEKAVGEIAPLFETKQTRQPNADAASKAAEAISKAKTKAPTSLSQVPAGARAHHDEGEAIREMDINQLSRSMESKTPEEIMRLMNRVL
jgi:hypothetical protein